MGPHRVTIAVVVATLGFAATTASAEWQMTTPLPSPVAYFNAVSNGSFVYQIGGLDQIEGACGSKKGRFAALNSDGTVGFWSPTTPLPALSGPSTIDPTCDVFVRLIGQNTVYSSSHIYVLGGTVVDSTGNTPIETSSGVYHSSINSDGTLGAWSSGPPLPVSLQFAASTVWNGVVYVTGGWHQEINLTNPDFPVAYFVNTVYFSKINADGSLGPWQTGTPLPVPEAYVHAAVAANGNLYVSGGTINGGNQFTNSVYHAPINPDGSIGAWQADAPLPSPTSLHSMVERHGMLYVIGGFLNSALNSVYVAPIGSDGSIANWSSSDALPSVQWGLWGHGSTLGGDTLYTLGGIDDLSIQSGVYYHRDIIAPSAISDMTTQALNSSSVQLNWTAPGNDGTSGRVENGQHEIRYSANASDFSSFDTIPNSLVISANYEPGDPQNALLAGLSPGTQYYVAAKTIDRSGNRSATSNVSSVMTYYLATSTETPARMKLESVFPSFNIQIVSEQQAALALQTAPGALASSIYEIAPSGTNLDPPGILTFAFDGSVDPSKIAIYKYIDSTVGWSSASITGQVVDGANLTITGRLASTSMYALFTLKKPKPVESAAFNIFVSPATLNLKSQGKWITVYFEAASGAASVSDLDSKSLRLTAVNGNEINPIYASGKSSIGDGNSNGTADLGVKFDRASVQAVLAAGQANLQFSGALRSGLSFSGSSVLRVIAPPNSNSSAGSLAKAIYSPTPPKLKKFLELSRSTKVLSFKEFVALLADTDSADLNASVRKVVGPKRIIVTIPNDAAAPELAITVSTSVHESPLDVISRKLAAEEKKLIAAAEPVEFGPHGTIFSKPVTLELPYNRSALPPGLDEASLTVQYWNPGIGKWEAMPSSVDKQAQVVRAQTSHFSLYQIFGGGSAASAPASPNDPTFKVNASYAFPSPSRGGAPVVIRVQPGQADSVSVRIYDLSGRMVHESSNFSMSNLDDLNGFGSQITFDHTWDVSGVASGVYNFIVTARKAGAGDIHKSGKVGVIK